MEFGVFVIWVAFFFVIMQETLNMKVGRLIYFRYLFRWYGGFCTKIHLTLALNIELMMIVYKKDLVAKHTIAWQQDLNRIIK